MDVSIDAVSGHHKGLFPRKLPDDADCYLTSGGAGRSCCGDSLRGESIWQRDFRLLHDGHMGDVECDDCGRVCDSCDAVLCIERNERSARQLDDYANRNGSTDIWASL